MADGAIFKDVSAEEQTPGNAATLGPGRIDRRRVFDESAALEGAGIFHSRVGDRAGSLRRRAESSDEKDRKHRCELHLAIVYRQLCLNAREGLQPWIAMSM